MLRTESIEPRASVRRNGGVPRCRSNAVASRTRVAPYVLRVGDHRRRVRRPLDAVAAVAPLHEDDVRDHAAVRVGDRLSPAPRPGCRGRRRPTSRRPSRPAPPRASGGRRRSRRTASAPARGTRRPAVRWARASTRRRHGRRPSRRRHRPGASPEPARSPSVRRSGSPTRAWSTGSPLVPNVIEIRPTLTPCTSNTSGRRAYARRGEGAGVRQVAAVERVASCAPGR